MATINNMITANQTRPCWANGRRAIFHRWTDSARPVKPKGMEDEDTLDRYQLHSVHGLVEFEDGHMERVWPSNIQFADGGGFDAYDWETMEAKRDAMEPGPAEEQPALDFLAKALNLPGGIKRTTLPPRRCTNCKNNPEDTGPCDLANYDCRRCKNTGCICKSCEAKNKWEALE